MPNSRNPDSYERLMHEITYLLSSPSAPSRFPIEFPSERTAYVFRRRFYSFLKALETAGKDSTRPYDVRQEFREQARLSRAFMLKIESTGGPDDPATLLFLDRDQTPENQHLAAQIYDAMRDRGIDPNSLLPPQAQAQPDTSLPHTDQRDALAQLFPNSTLAQEQSTAAGGKTRSTANADKREESPKREDTPKPLPANLAPSVNKEQDDE